MSLFHAICVVFRRRWVRIVFALTVVAVVAGAVYVRMHPLVFMEVHAHCIKMAGMELLNYADANEGRFPYHPRGYGNALLLLDEQCFHALTGPGYSPAPFHAAKKAGTDLAEEECGRVYVQGLTKRSNPELVLLFDKLPTPGGDHCHLPFRLWAPLGREVVDVTGFDRFVPESEWPAFAARQIELLTAEGFEREEAERLYESKPVNRT